MGIVKINIGQYVNVGTEIVRVEDTGSMKVDFALSQNDLDKLHIGQRVTATVDARSGETFSARITAIEPAVNAATGLVDILQHLIQKMDVNCFQYKTVCVLRFQRKNKSNCRATSRYQLQYAW